MDETLADLVRRRASNRCEYCQLPQEYSTTRLQFDHIIPEQHGGTTVTANLALACLADNNHKGPNLAGIDPKASRKTWLFNPRRHKWSRHFRWNGPILVGRTPRGRATVMVLAMNLPHRVAQRAALMAEGVFPPTLV